MLWKLEGNLKYHINITKNEYTRLYAYKFVINSIKVLTNTTNRIRNFPQIKLYCLVLVFG